MKRRRKSWIDAILCFLGIVGTMGCFLQMYSLPINNYMLVVLMSITSLFFFFLYGSKTKKQWMKWSMLAYVIVVILTFSYWKDGFAFLMNTMFRVYESNSQYTFQRFTVMRDMANQSTMLLLTIWILFTPMCAIIVRSIRAQHSFILCFIVTIPFIFSILLFTLRPHPWFFAMLLVFYFAIVGMGTAGHHRVQVQAYALQKMGLLFGCSGLAFILLFTFLFPEQSYVRDENVEGFRLAIQVKIREIIEGRKQDEQGELDLASAGNRFYIGSDQLKVEMENPQTLYLHGYSASEYKDNKWQNSEDNTNLMDASSLNFAMLYEKDLKIQTLTLTYIDEPQNYLYTPYAFLDNVQDSFDVVQDQYVAITNRTDNNYTMRFGFLDEVNRENLEQQAYQKDYYDAVKDKNLQVPNSVANVIQSLDIEGLRAAQSNEEKIDLIQSYMQDFGEYTLSPGITPEGEDFIHYFLLNNKRGYCVHYASAATMLLRYYGITARYASGYRVDRSSFVDGVAIAEDYQQHAWVEVFDPLFGWVPLEVTPVSNGSSSSENPNTGNNANNTPNNNPDDPNETQDTPAQNDSTKPSVEDTGWWETTVLIWGGLLVGMLAILIGIPLRRFILVRRRNLAMHQKDYKKAILACDEYVTLLQVENIPDDIWTILEEARYSAHPMSKTQYDKIVAYCETMKTQHILQCTLKTRFMERYLKGYY